MSKSSKRRAFHVSTKLLTAGVLMGGVALDAGCKPEHEVTSNPAPITPPQATSADMGATQLVPASEPKRVNSGPVRVDMDVYKPAPDMAKSPAADASADEAVLEKSKPSVLDSAIYRPNVNTQHIRRPAPVLVAPKSPKKP